MPTIQLQSVPHPDRPRLKVSIYDGPQDAWKHLQNHVLTAPECQAWAVVQPQLLDVIDLYDPDACWQFRRQVDRWSAHDTGDEAEDQTKDHAGENVLQPLYDRYAVAVQEAARSAQRLGWHVRHELRRVTVALGLNGVLQVYKRNLKTAFLPGHGNAQESIAARREGRLRRDSSPDSLAGSMRGMRIGRTPSQRALAREERRRQMRTAEQSTDQKRYHVFRKAVQAIRADNRVALNGDGTAHSTADYALLKAVLPSMSRLRLADWLTYDTGGAN